MTITISIPEELAWYAQAIGLSAEAYVEELVADAAYIDSWSTAPLPDGQRRAVEDLFAFRHTHGLSLGRDLSVGLRAWLHQDQKR